MQSSGKTEGMLASIGPSPAVNLWRAEGRVEGEKYSTAQKQALLSVVASSCRCSRI
jgi:hypothetical protein